MIYLDYNASTPTAPEVKAAMLPYFTQHYGNPSSGHWAGREARAAVEQARAEVATLLNATPEEIVFTSGATEANNYALKGAFYSCGKSKPHFVISSIEHPAVLSPMRFLEGLGARVTQVPVGRDGIVDPNAIADSITSDTVLVSVMHANNEVGTIQPLQEISHVTRERRVLLHTDAAQSVGKIEVRADELGADLITLAGHKMYAPKGVGALYIRSGTRLTSLLHGAGHEGARRAGTENVPYVVALGAASRLVAHNLKEEAARQLRLREKLHGALEGFYGARLSLNGDRARRLPNTLNVSIDEINASELLQQLPEVAASTGAACHSGTTHPSHVLSAMGVPERLALGTIRFSIGRYTTEEEINRVSRLISRGQNSSEPAKATLAGYWL